MQPGQSIGHYRIVRLIGQGGMGAVYLAEDTKLHRQVALKILPPEMAASPDRLERFQREAQAVAALNHPHIVTIYSVEDDAGTHFLTMELVEGESLDQGCPRQHRLRARLPRRGRPRLRVARQGRPVRRPRPLRDPDAISIRQHPEGPALAPLPAPDWQSPRTARRDQIQGDAARPVGAGGPRGEEDGPALHAEVMTMRGFQTVARRKRDFIQPHSLVGAGSLREAPAGRIAAVLAHEQSRHALERPARLKGPHQRRHHALTVLQTDGVHGGILEGLGADRDGVPPGESEHLRIDRFRAPRDREDLGGVQRVRPGDAHDVRAVARHQSLEAAREPRIVDRGVVAVRLQRGGDVLDSERLDPEEGAETEPFVG